MYFDILLSSLVRGLKVGWKYISLNYTLDQRLPHSCFSSQKMLVWPFLTRLIISIMPKMVPPPNQLSHPYIVFVHNWCFISLNDPNQPEPVTPDLYLDFNGSAGDGSWSICSCCPGRSEWLDQRTSYSERSQHPLSQLDKYLGDNVLYRVSFFNA